MHPSYDDIEPFHTDTRMARELGRDASRDAPKPKAIPALDDPTYGAEWWMGKLMRDALWAIALTADGGVTKLEEADTPIRERINWTARRRALLASGLDEQAADATIKGEQARIRALSAGGEYKHKGSYRVSRMPSSTLVEVVDWLERRYWHARTNRERLEVILDTQAIGHLLRYSPDRSKVRDTQEWREAIANDPRSPEIVGQVYGISPRTVRRIRKKAGTARPAHRPKSREEREADRACEFRTKRTYFPSCAKQPCGIGA